MVDLLQIQWDDGCYRQWLKHLIPVLQSSESDPEDFSHVDNLTCFKKCSSPSSSTELSGLSTTSAFALPGGLANGGRGIGSVGQRVYVFQDKREEFFFVYI